MPKNINVEGKIDAGYTSYYDPEKHKEAVAGTPKEDEGEVAIDVLPNEIEASELSSRQEEIITTAVLNAEKSSSAIDNMLDLPAGSTGTCLRRKIPDWYNSNFSSSGQGTSNEGTDETTDERAGHTTEKDLFSRIEGILDDGIGRSDLNDGQMEVLDKCVEQMDKSTNEISEQFDRSQSSVTYILRKKANEWYNTEFKVKGNSKDISEMEKKVGDDDLLEKIESFGSLTRSTAADQFDVSKETARRHLKSLKDDGYVVEEEAGDDYHPNTMVYKLADQGDQTDEEKVEKEFEIPSGESKIAEEKRVEIVCEYISESGAEGSELAQYVLDALY